MSNIISYAILITITISLSVLVANWLRFYVAEPDVNECPPNVKVVFESYNCIKGENGEFNGTIRNTGLFTIDGVFFRGSDEPGATFGETISITNVTIAPGEIYNGLHHFNKNNVNGRIFEELTLVEAQPWINDSNGGRILCPDIATLRVECLAGNATT